MNLKIVHSRFIGAKKTTNTLIFIKIYLFISQNDEIFKFKYVKKTPSQHLKTKDYS
jgi:hypothetical protein